MVGASGGGWSVLGALGAGKNEVVEDRDAPASGVSETSGEDVRLYLAALLALNRLRVRPEELLLDELNSLEGQVVRRVFRLLGPLEPVGGAYKSFLADVAVGVGDLIENGDLLLSGHLRLKKDEVGEQLSPADEACGVGVEVTDESHEGLHGHLVPFLRQRASVSLEALGGIHAGLEELVEELDV